MNKMIGRWLDRVVNLFSLSELKRLDREQVSELAREVGVTSEQLISMEAAGTGSAAQLSKRLHCLDLEEKQLPLTDWAALRDMQRVCSVCGTKWQCEQDLRDRPNDPRWLQYCPNAETLRGLAKR